MTADDDIDALYCVAPEGFTALRTELVAAAKKRGDAQAATSIAAARKPTTAAWVLNVLVRSDATVRGRCHDLTEELKAAHAAMDGARIRELSATQRRLIDELVRAGFAAAGLTSPSAALRDDVVGTLQAAIADPDVAARLGRLARAQRWSGFGDFGSVSTVGVAASASRRAERGRPQPPADVNRAGEATAARKRVVAARRDAEDAEQAHAGAVDALSARTAALATARRRYEKLLESLSAAEAELNTAEADHADAKVAAQAAADRVEATTSVLAGAESELATIVARER